MRPKNCGFYKLTTSTSSPVWYCVVLHSTCIAPPDQVQVENQSWWAIEVM